MSKMNKSTRSYQEQSTKEGKSKNTTQTKRSGNDRRSKGNADRSKYKGPDGEKISRQDPDWYTRYPELARSVSGLPSEVELGILEKRCFDSSLNSNVDDEVKSLPGALSIEFYPAMGVSSGIDSPLNTLARERYTALIGTGRRPTWDWTLYGLYTMIIDSGLMLYAHCSRILGLSNMRNPYNSFFPDSILTLMNYSAANFATATNRHELYQEIVEMGRFLNTLPYPAGLNLFKRHMYLAGNVFLDEKDNPSAQVIVFSPRGYYRFNEATNPQVLSAKMSFFSTSNAIQPADLINAMQSWRAYISNSDAFLTMISDIKRLWPTALLQVELPASEMFTFMPIYDENVLFTVNNMEAYGEIDTSTLDISIAVNSSGYGPTPYLEATPALSSINYSPTGIQHYMNADKPSLEPGDFIEYNRLKCTLEPADVTGTQLSTYTCSPAFTSVGTEIIDRAKYCVRRVNSSGTISGTNYVWRSVVASPLTVDAFSSTTINVLRGLPAFKHFPRTIFLHGKNSDTKWVCSGDMWDDNYITYIPEETIARQHKYALASLIEAYDVQAGKT